MKPRPLAVMIFYAILVVSWISMGVLGHAQEIQPSTDLFGVVTLTGHPSLSGWFTIVWGDPVPGSNDEPVEIYMLIALVTS